MARWYWAQQRSKSQGMMTFADICISHTEQSTDVFPHNSNTNVDYKLAKDIMERACKFCPELTNGKGPKKLDVEGHIVGIRPGRLGGPRVENEFKSKYNGKEGPSSDLMIDYETTASFSGKPIIVTHNYGHDGSGFQSSWGSAKHVAKLVEEGYASLQSKSASIQTLLSSRL